MEFKEPTLLFRFGGGILYLVYNMSTIKNMCRNLCCLTGVGNDCLGTTPGFEMAVSIDLLVG